MRVGLSFGFGLLRVYLPLSGGRHRRRSKAKAWTHPGCTARHRTQAAAEKCKWGHPAAHAQPMQHQRDPSLRLTPEWGLDAARLAAKHHSDIAMRADDLLASSHHLERYQLVMQLTAYEYAELCQEHPRDGGSSPVAVGAERRRASIAGMLTN